MALPVTGAATFDCMTPAEFELWAEAAADKRSRAAAPCVDCPLEYHREMVAAGRCDRVPQPDGGAPRKARTVDGERLAARRQSWREYKQRVRARAGIA